jgi:hypothetical protein
MSILDLRLGLTNILRGWSPGGENDLIRGITSFSLPVISMAFWLEPLGWKILG